MRLHIFSAVVATLIRVPDDLFSYRGDGFPFRRAMLYAMMTSSQTWGSCLKEM
jgi:hypothetical protein